jgi:hypothetical protein
MKRELIAIGVFCVGTTSTAIPQSVNPGAGPISVTRATCDGATSVSVTTSYAPPQGSIWVFTNLGSRKVIATVDQPTPLAASTFQFSVNASEGNVSLVIENSLASAITSPYAITCNSPALAATGAPEAAAASARPVAIKGMSAEVSARPVATKGEMVKLPTVPVVFPQEALKLESKPAIKFVPFEMVDFKTGKPVAPTAMLTLPDGKQVQAKAFYDQLNQYEEWFSAHGTSIRQPQEHAEIEIASIPVDTELLQRQVSASPRPTSLPVRANLLEAQSLKTLSVPQPIHFDSSEPLAQKINAAGLHGIVLNGFVVDPATLVAIGKIIINSRQIVPPPCVPINKSQSWNWTTGSQSKFSAYVDGTIAVTGQACPGPVPPYSVGNKSNFAITADAKAGGYVFNQGASGDAPSNTVNASFQAFVLGHSVYSLSKSASSNWVINQPLSKSVDFSASMAVPVGPIDINLTIGAAGTAGVDFSLFLYPTTLVGAVGPFVNSSVYAQAGVGILDVSAGVGVNMVLVNGAVNLSDAVFIGWAPTTGGYSLDSQLYADANLNMLNGNVYAYAEIGYPCVPKFWDWCTSQYDVNLWTWTGYQYKSVVFNDANSIPLGW